MARKNGGMITPPVRNNAHLAPLCTEQGNEPLLDADGLFKACITAVDPKPVVDPTKAPRFTWWIQGEGTIRPKTYKFTTVRSLVNDDDTIEMEEILEEDGEGGESESPPYNDLAKLCLALELITPEDLLGDTLPRVNVRAAVGLAIRCALAKRNMTQTKRDKKYTIAWIEPVIDTITLDQSL
jgi:hypothetical protein